VKKIFLILIVIIFFSALSASASTINEIKTLSKNLSKDYVEKKQKPLFKKSLAILKFKNLGTTLKKNNIGEIISNFLSAEFNNSTIFKLVERENLKKIFKEIELGMSGATDDETSIEPGKIKGAELLLIGSISEVGKSFVITAKLIDTETAKIISVSTVTIPREKLLKIANMAYWSSFQSKYGISIEANGGFAIPIYLSNPSAEMIANFNIHYKPFKYLRFGLGMMIGSFSNIKEEKIDYQIDYPGINVPNLYEIRRFYRANYMGINFSIDGVIPVINWLNVIIGVKYTLCAGDGTNIIQQVHGFPVPDPLANDPSTSAFVEKRLVIKSYGPILHFLTPRVAVEFLISKRISINISTGFSFSWVFEPEIYEIDGDQRQTGDTDENGTSALYPYFNFSRFDVNGDRISFNFSNVSITLGLALHL